MYAVLEQILAQYITNIGWLREQDPVLRKNPGNHLTRVIHPFFNETLHNDDSK